MFPPAIEQVLTRFNVAAPTRARLYDLYLTLGNDAVEAFGRIAEDLGGPDKVEVGDLGPIRSMVVDGFLERNHGAWLEGRPTPSLWHPREAEGRAAGVLIPLGRIGPPELENDFAARVHSAVAAIVGPGESVPFGVLLFGKNAHSGGRRETISFDVVSYDLGEAKILASAEGHQHTVPGSVGETSGTIDVARNLALIWEIQPNVLEPVEERNGDAARLIRRHRNWHVATLVAALQWLESHDLATFVIRGAALEPTHQLDSGLAVSDEIAALHERTVERVARGLARDLGEPSGSDLRRLLESDLPNTGLRKVLGGQDPGRAIWRIGPGEMA